MADPSFTLGVEEEYFLVDAETLELRPRAETVLEDARSVLGERVEPELNLAQIETSTPVSSSLDEVEQHLRKLRSSTMEAAAHSESRIAAIGTHPFSEWIAQQITPRARYENLDATYQQLAWEQLVSGCHVHVGVEDPELAIQVSNHMRPWLPVLRALTTNSPYWQGVDTGYASFRTGVFDRWPTTGTPPLLRDRAEYDDLVAGLVATDALEDASKLYWDVRPSMRYPTLEIRVADVCPTVEEAVMLAGLSRALVRASVAAIRRGEAAPAIHQDLVRAARWRAARYGLDGTLADVHARVARPAGMVVDELLEHVRPDLETHGEWERVTAVVGTVLRDGTGSARQRRVYEETGDLRAVVRAAIAQTAPVSLTR